MDGCFSEDYVEAREKFTLAAQEAGAEIGNVWRRCSWDKVWQHATRLSEAWR